MIYGFDGIAQAYGLPTAERIVAAELVEIHAAHMAANVDKGRYYDQRVTAGECNLGIALPSDMRNFEMACCWPEKAVTALMPPEKWGAAHHWLIWHGRRVCRAQRPLCEKCALKELCRDYRERTGGKTADETGEQE